jgi:hypothetical protein
MLLRNLLWFLVPYAALLAFVGVALR